MEEKKTSLPMEDLSGAAGGLSEAVQKQVEHCRRNGLLEHFPREHDGERHRPCHRGGYLRHMYDYEDEGENFSLYTCDICGDSIIYLKEN